MNGQGDHRGAHSEHDTVGTAQQGCAEAVPSTCCYSRIRVRYSRRASSTRSYCKRYALSGLTNSVSPLQPVTVQTSQHRDVGHTMPWAHTHTELLVVSTCERDGVD